MNPIMQPIINKYVVLYVAHPFGGDLDNVSRAEIQLSKLRKLLPRHTLRILHTRRLRGHEKDP